jgi:inorganic pyrophosphatase
MNMIDGGEGDDKVIAVPVSDPRWSDVKDLKDLNKHTLKEIEHFYSTYKKLQNKEVIVNGFKGAAEARIAFKEGLALYQKKFGKGSKKK